MCLTFTQTILHFIEIFLACDAFIRILGYVHINKINLKNDFLYLLCGSLHTVLTWIQGFLFAKIAFNVLYM